MVRKSQTTDDERDEYSSNHKEDNEMNFDKKIEIAKHHQALQAKENANYIFIDQLLAELIKRYPDTDLAVIKKHLVDLFFTDKVKIYKRHTLNGDWTHISHLTCLELGTKEFVPVLFPIDRQYYEDIVAEAEQRLSEPDAFCDTAFNLAEIEKILGFELTSEPPVSGSQELKKLKAENEELKKICSTPILNAETYAVRREEILKAAITLIAHGYIKFTYKDNSRIFSATQLERAIFEHADKFWPKSGIPPLSSEKILKILRESIGLFDSLGNPDLESRRKHLKK